MSHSSILATWAQLEKRADLTTTLRDAVGQYAIQTVLCGKDYSTRESIRAFNRLISIVRTAFHLQRIYLQSRQPSPSIEPFLIEPSLIIEILIFLLAVKDECIPVRGDLGLVEEQILRSIGALLLAGLRLLTLYKSKVELPLNLDWASKADLLKTKLANWPLGDRVYRFLIGELCLGFLEALSSTAEAPLTGSVKPCGHHDKHPGAEEDVDLPNLNDGLYPLKPELRDVISRTMSCIYCQCPWWFQSFCAWYDIWSALIGASVQQYRRITETNKDALDETLIGLVSDFIEEAKECDAASNSSRFAAINETFFALNPFPQCSINGCSCFGYRLQHRYQELQYPGVWQHASTDVVDLPFDIASDLERRKASLRDADGYIHKVAKDTQDGVRDWTGEEVALESGQLKTYIIDCPMLHPLTSHVLVQHLESMGQESAAEEIQSTAELVEIDGLNGLKCPTCETKSFKKARLLRPLNVLDQMLSVPRLDSNLQELPLKIKLSLDRSKRMSATSRSLNSSSSRSWSRTLQGGQANHSRKDSGENASQSSSKGKISKRIKSGSSSSKLQVSSVLFTDGKFVLAFTSKRISCYDCELETWSIGHDFTRITLVAGSSVRYAVVSKETHTYKLTVFRRDHILEEEEWSKDLGTQQPLSIAFPHQGHRVALGFEKGVQVFDGMIDNFEILPLATPEKAKADLQVDSQSLSFSFCGNHLVVAYRARCEGKVFVMVHDLQPLQRQDQRMPDITIQKNLAGEFGLSSVIYDHASSTICICSSAAQENPWLVDRTHPRKSIRIANNSFTHFPGEQIQCAVVVPGTVPRIVMVNHSNKVFILRFEYGRWNSYQIKVPMDGRGEIVRADEKMSIAAMDGAVRLFWMDGQDGMMLTIDTSEAQQGYTPQSKKITTPF